MVHRKKVSHWFDVFDFLLDIHFIESVLYVHIFIEQPHKVFAVAFSYKCNYSPPCLTKCFLLEFFNFAHTIRERAMIHLEICLKES